MNIDKNEFRKYAVKHHRIGGMHVDRYIIKNLSASQLHFVKLIVDHLTANGAMEVARLYESPFTDQAPHGPDTFFTDEQIDGIVEILADVRTHALPDVVSA